MPAVETPIQKARVPENDVTGRARARTRAAAIFWIAVLFLGGFQFWISRQTMNTDGISYQDMADAIARGSWSAAANAYWSPLYPCLLAAGRILFRPSAHGEFAVVHLVNLLIFLGAAGGFQFFLISLIRYLRRNESRAGTPLPEWALEFLGYSLFLWSSLALINLSVVSPDLSVALFVFLASGIILRIKTGDPGVGNFVLLGVVLGLGYLAKAAMMPLGLVFFASAFLAACHRRVPTTSEDNATIPMLLRKAAPRVALGLAVFLLVSAPLIVGISKSKGRLTIGDSARLNWVWYINHVPRYHWQGIPAVGVPTHPTRKLFSAPGVYEFDSPATVTYDIWYDPSYWNDGIRPRIDIKTLIGQLRNNLRFYFRFFFGRQIGIMVVCVFLLLRGARGKELLAHLAEYREELLPPIAALAMYAPVYVETRYIAPFVVVLWMGLFAAVRLPQIAARKRAAICAVGVAVVFILVSLGVSIADAKGPYRLSDALRWRTPFLQFEVAEGLHNMGIEPGDKVAWIRPKAPARERYDWARLGRLRIIAEIPGVEEKAFWTATPDVQAQVVRVLEGTEAKALIATQAPLPGSALDWQPIGSTGFYLVFLRK